MLRLIIVDDEKVIRETICSLIDWNSIGIEVVGLCKNGYEALEMIQDEYPDIVLTDIKMPGLSGLELIKRISQTDKDIEFIILSGYGEFSFAKEAMEWGVKYYLLKPTNEKQIIDVVKKVTEECYRKKAFSHINEEKQILQKKLHESIVRNIIAEGLTGNSNLYALTEQYGQYLDFTGRNYELYCIYYLDEKNLSECMNSLLEYKKKHFPGIPLYGVYVSNTLMVFFECFDTNYDHFDRFVSGLSFPDQPADIDYKRVSHKNLNSLLEHIIHKLKRYDKIYILDGVHKALAVNYTLFADVEHISTMLLHENLKEKRIKLINKIKELLGPIKDPGLLKTLITNFLLKQQANNFSKLSPVNITEFLLELNKFDDAQKIYTTFLSKLQDIVNKEPGKNGKYDGFVRELLDYVHDNLSNPNLTLKMICENYLFMNVDHVSKQFVKQTGIKFSSYLTQARIEKAKSLLLDSSTEKISHIARKVGYGNNPQYFSQTFKKLTNMTPTEYVKKMHG